MTIQVELWQLVGFLGGFLATVLPFAFGFGRTLLVQIDRRLDQRFKAIEKAADDWRRIERDLLSFKADLPLHYVRREDYVRNQTVIEAKLDALALRLETHPWQERP